MKSRHLDQFRRQKQLQRTYRILRWTILAGAVTVIALGGLLIARRNARRAAEMQLIRRAHAAFDRGEMEKAKSLYSEVLRIYPNNDLSHKNMGLIYLEEGDAQKAFEELARAYRLNRSMTVARDKALDILLASGDFKRTEEEARGLLMTDPESFFLRRCLVLSLAGMGELRKAQEEADRMLEMHSREPDAYRIAAEIYAARGQPDAAEKTLLDGIRACPGAPALRIALGSFQLAREEGAKAEKQFREAIRIAPERAEGHIALAEHYRSLGEREKAEAEYRKGIEKDPANVGMLYSLSSLLIDAADEEGAARAVAMLEREAPDHWLTHIGRGRLLSLQGKRSDAGQQLGVVPENMPYTAKAFLILAQAEVQAGMLAQAEDHVRKARDLNPGGRDAAILMARLSLGNERFGDAIDACRRILLQSPDDREALLVKGSAHVGIKDDAEAERCFRELIDRHPRCPGGYFQLGRLLSRQHRYDQASEVLEKAASLQPENMDILRQLAESYHHSGDHAGAVARCATAARAMPEEGGPLIIAGDIHGMAGELDEARECFLRATRKDPDNPLPHIGMGRIHAARGDSDGAIREFKRAEEIDANCTLTHLLLGLALEERGELEQAREHYSRVSGPSPEAGPAITGMARTYLAQGDEEMGLPSDYGLLVRLGNLFLAAGDVRRASACVERISRVNPEGLDGVKLQGTLMLAQGNMKGAVDIFRAALRDDPRDASSRYCLAAALYGTGELAAAAGEAETACALSKDEAHARILLASIYLAQGHSRKALRELDRVKGTKARDNEIRQIEAIANFRLGRFSLAEKELRGILDSAPANAAARNYLILACICQGNVQDAKREFEKAAPTPSDFERALSSLTLTFLGEKREKKGLEMYGSLLEERGESPALYLEIGKLHSARGESERARESFERALKTDEKFAPAYLSLGKLSEERGDHSDAIGLYRKALQTDPTSLHPSLLLANAYIKESRKDDAIALYEKALEGWPDVPEILNNLAYLYAEKEGGLERAGELARRAHSLEADNPAVLDTLGWICCKDEEYEEAVHLLEKSVRIRPSNPTTLYHLGAAYYKSGRAREAERELERAMKMDSHMEWSADAAKMLEEIWRR